jgi:hypothetical protein
MIMKICCVERDADGIRWLSLHTPSRMYSNVMLVRKNSDFARATATMACTHNNTDNTVHCIHSTARHGDAVANGTPYLNQRVHKLRRACSKRGQPAQRAPHCRLQSWNDGAGATQVQEGRHHTPARQHLADVGLLPQHHGKQREQASTQRVIRVAAHDTGAAHHDDAQRTSHTQHTRCRTACDRE